MEHIVSPYYEKLGLNPDDYKNINLSGLGFSYRLSTRLEMKQLILLLLVVMTLTGCGETAQNDRETAILYTGKDHLTARGTVVTFSRRFGCSVTVMENGEHWFHTEEQVAVLDAWLRKEI